MPKAYILQLKDAIIFEEVFENQDMKLLNDLNDFFSELLGFKNIEDD